MAPRSRSYSLGHARHGAVVSSYYSTITPPNPTQAETTALLAAMTVQPNAARATLINDMIFALKNAGAWTTFDLLYVFAAHDPQAGRINWISPAQVLPISGGAPVFTLDRGVSGDGTTAYLDSGINVSGLTKLQQDNCAAGVYIQNNATGANAVVGLLAVQQISIVPRSAADNASTRLLSTTVTNTPMTDSRGHLCLTRSIPASYDRYKAGVFIDTPAAVSAARAASSITILRNVAAFSSNHILAAAHYGSSLTPTQIGQVNTALANYMSGIGA
jgi:hypothetical protein